MKPIFHGRTLVYTSALLLLAACGGGGSGGSDNTTGGNTDGGTPPVTPGKPADLALSVSHLPPGASLALVQTRAGATQQTLTFQKDDKQSLSNADKGDALQIRVTPAQPQTALLQCEFANSELGNIQSDGSFNLTQVPQDKASLSVTCSESVLAMGGFNALSSNQIEAAAFWLNLDQARITWIKDPDGEPVRNGLWPGPSADKMAAYLNNQGYFAAVHPTQGNELWVSAGPASGAKVAVNIVEETGNSVLHSRPSNFVTVGGQYLYARVSKEGRRLGLATDLVETQGTPATTTFINQNSDNTLLPVQTGQLAAMGGKLYFMTNGGESPTGELWVRDPVAQTTTLVASPGKVVADTSYSVGNNNELLMPVGNQLFFSINENNYGAYPPYILAVSDGTAAGTRELFSTAEMEEARPSSVGDPTATLFTQFKDELFFLRKTSDYGRELWKTDGTTHTRLSDIGAGALHGEINFLTTLKTGVLFQANDGQGPALWFTEGTLDSTRKVVPGSTVTPFVPEPSNRAAQIPTPFHATATHAVFVGTDGHIWSSNGTASGTQRLFPKAADGTPVHATGECKADSCKLAQLQRVGNQVLIEIVSISGTTRKTEYWLTDGSPAGTRAVQDADGQAFAHEIVMG
ncbi:hypothetical protein [Kerstersia similis]|uniref:hypothetical protein n=1 Tax=Kerstersia similis TaxID=206505 RepID=UPI0039EDF50D